MQNLTHKTLPVENVDNFDWRKLIVRSAVVLFVFVAAFVLFYVVAHDWIRATGRWVGHHFGLVGIGIGSFIVDFLPTPASPAIFFPFVLEWSPIALLATVTIASMLAGSAGYFVGRSLDRFPKIDAFTARFRKHGEALIKKYGFWAVAVGALIPIPFSLVCWTSGMVKVPYKHVLIGTLFRIPRMVIYYFAIRGGIGIFGPH